MVSSEERQCQHCGSFHLRNISFFAYWIQCKECGAYLCPRCSGYQDSRLSQFLFLAYMLISFIYYLGIYLIIAPITGGTINALSSYLFAGILLFVPFFFLLLVVRSAIRKLSQQNEGIISNCPQCNGTMRVVYHDIFLYFWLFFIHTLYIATISNEIGIIFYNFDVTGVSLSIFFVLILIGMIIFIIWLFKRVGERLMHTYKMNTRVWLGEILAIFLYISINIIFILFIAIIANFASIPNLTNDAFIMFNMFYSFTSIIFWYFPAFLIGSLIYKLAQKYLLNINKSKIIQILIAISFIIIPFYLWGFISLQLGVYQQPSFYIATHEILPFYSTIFNEIIPLILISFLLGISIIYLVRSFFSKANKAPQKGSRKIILISGISLFTGFILVENLFYLFSGTYLVDLFPSSISFLLLLLVLIGSLILIFYEILTNWVSPQSSWGKVLEKHLGSLLYPVILGFILIALSLSFSIIILASSSLTIIPFFSLSTEIPTLKLIFIISFISGLLIGLKKQF